MKPDVLLRMEIARMFGQWPHDLLAVSSSEYRRLQRYYFAVKDAQKPNSGDSDLPDGVEVIE